MFLILSQFGLLDISIDNTDYGPMLGQCWDQARALLSLVPCHDYEETIMEPCLVKLYFKTS